MSYEAYGSEAAVDALLEFLRDGTHGGATSPADTFNGVLAARRATLGVTTATLPDIAEFVAYWPFADERATHTPQLVVGWRGSAGEELPPTGRSFDHVLEVMIFLTDADVLGSEVEAAKAAARYSDALRVMLNRRVKQEQGHTLNNGGTGAAQGRVISCQVQRQEYAVAGTPPNFMTIAEIRVRMSEAY